MKTKLATSAKNNPARHANFAGLAAMNPAQSIHIPLVGEIMQEKAKVRNDAASVNQSIRRKRHEKRPHPKASGTAKRAKQR
jgi:hypothetical protein